MEKASQTVDATTKGLLDYCEERDILISLRIAPRRIPGRGLGIYSTARIARGEKLMHVPATALLTTKSIPNSFVNQTARKHIPVHAQLAAYLTFGLEEHSNSYEKWMATWPRLADFTSSMPMLWPKQRMKPHPTESSAKPAKRQKTLHVAGPPLGILPPPTTGAWSMSFSNIYPSGATPVATAQLFKLQSHIKQIAALFPHYSDTLLSPLSPVHWRFVHMWCCVNTRCFYYLHPRQTKPSDPNEAMAMCPGMDLFNHTDKPGCVTKYEKSGYKVMADRDYEADEEILLSYGTHTNDVLWAEYGFMMDENSDDAVKIDEPVLRRLSVIGRSILEEYGYLEEYWIKSDGPCWRTEVAAWAHVLSDRDLKKVLAGIWMPNSVDKSYRKHRMKIEDWLNEIAAQCEENITWLTTMTSEQIVGLLGGTDDVLVAQGHIQSDIADVKKQVALYRHGMCLRRWEQIRQIIIQGSKTWLSAR